MKIFDSHTHLNLTEFENDFNKIIQANLKKEIWTVNIGTDKKSSLKAIEIAEKYTEGVYATIGIQPLSLFQSINKESQREVEKFNFSFYSNLVKNKKVVAIGEVGLDYHHFEDNHDIEKIKKLQQEVVYKFIKIAYQNQKPLVIHCWDAYDDLLKILEKFIEENNWSNETEKGIIHSFIGSWKTAQKFLDLGFLIGLNGIITYSISYDKLIRNCPLEKIVIETDAPYLTPAPLERFSRNEPKNVYLVAKKIAEVKNLSFKEVVKQTTKNTRKIFNV